MDDLTMESFKFPLLFITALFIYEVLANISKSISVKQRIMLAVLCSLLLFTNLYMAKLQAIKFEEYKATHTPVCRA